MSRWSTVVHGKDFAEIESDALAEARQFFGPLADSWAIPWESKAGETEYLPLSVEHLELDINPHIVRRGVDGSSYVVAYEAEVTVTW